MRTAKSCGPDASTLASSWRKLSAGDGDNKARSPGRARRKPLKPLRAGMPDDSGEPVVTTSCALYPFRTRDCGCIERPAFPTPSDLQMANLQAKLAQNLWRGRGGVCANQGLASPRPACGERFETERSGGSG